MSFCALPSLHFRLASPRHGFTIMNRLSMENLTEPITKDLDFQLQHPFLLYRNARCKEKDTHRHTSYACLLIIDTFSLQSHILIDSFCSQQLLSTVYVQDLFSSFIPSAISFRAILIVVNHAYQCQSGIS